MRIILVTANFAPRTGSHPTRTVHLVKYLRRLGHDVTVVTYNESQQLLYGARDSALNAKVPPDVDVRRVPSGWLHRGLDFAKRRGREVMDVKRRTSHNPLIPFLVPDPHCSAIWSFISATSRAIEERGCDVLITCSYPFTMILVGAAIKRRHRELVWVADYADPWSGAPFSELLLPEWRRSLDRQLERRALAYADAVTVTTPATASLYRRQFPGLRNVDVVTMGYDPEDSTHIRAAPRAEWDRGKLILLHAGRLNIDSRNPRPFVAALERCLSTCPKLVHTLKVVLLGHVDPEFSQAITRSPAAPLFDLQGWVDGAESIARMKAADILLLFGNRGAQQIPGKVFQYIGTGKPILMTCENPEDPTATIVHRYGSSLVVPNDTIRLSKALEGLIAGTTVLPQQNIDCSDFAWPNLTRKIVHVADAARRA